MKSRCRILVVSNKLTAGGAERFASAFVNGIDRRDFDVQLCLLRNEITYPLDKDLPCHILDQNSFLHSFRTVRRLRRLIRETNPDVVLSTVNYVSQFVGSAVRGLSNPPRWIARIGTSPHRTAQTVLQHIGQRWQKSVYPYADQIVANSEGSSRAFAQKFPSLADRVTCIPNGIDMAQLNQLADMPCPIKPSTDVPVLISVGRLHAVKRYDWLLNAFRLVLDSSPAELWIVGEGPERTNLEKQILELRLQDHVKLLGFQSNPYCFIKQASVFVMTSESESMPNAMLEAQALGLPAVAMDCDFGPREIIEDGESGHLVQLGDFSGVAVRILELLKSGTERLRSLEAALDRIRHRYQHASVQKAWAGILSGEVAG